MNTLQSCARKVSVYSLIRCLSVPTVLCVLVSSASAEPREYYRINVVDADTGRGVPLVELKTTSEVSYVTDSNGIVAVNDPELMGQKVYFHVKSHGYEYPKDMFGYSGTALDVKAGGQGQIKIKRINVAERLYRITGAGIYHDSILTGSAVPLKQPLMNGLVTGQDTVEATPYKGKIFWLWGDTNRVGYPLGNFKTSSATSLLPVNGGLDPSKGVDLTYWVDKEGFSKKMIPLEGSKPTWMGGLFTMNDDKGQERLFGSYANVESDSKVNEQGLAIFNDEKAEFEKLRAFPTVLSPGGDPFLATSGGQKYLYFEPNQRVLADYQHIIDGLQYQAYTPLVAGSKNDGANTKLERGADGQLVYGWKTNTARLGRGEVKKLVEAGKMKPEESTIQFHDIATDDFVEPHGSSTYWNPFRKRWVQIFSQASGTSYLGELWFAEADTPTGPWVYARKILTHDKYTFYNPTQHPFFNQENGRLVYFEGTYTTTYSGNNERTPRYDYNQIMYRLTMDDPRLTLPVPVYRLKTDGHYELGDTISAGGKGKQVESIPFFAMPATAKPDGLTAIYANGSQLQTAPNGKPLFYALPATATDNSKPSPALTPLYEYTKGQQRWYSTNADEKGDGITRTPQPLCRVWRNPSTALALDWDTKAVDN
ncbi:hypothetical protein EON83_20020 [bacterium]|nr:MAG: hypothetical protein EON83_20020 [bacterium]